MEYYAWDLHPVYHNGKVYKGEQYPEMVMMLETENNENFLEYMNKHWYDELCPACSEDESLKLNRTYYITSEDNNEYYVLSLHKGYTFWDVAEHDERVIIAVELGLTKEQAHI